MEKVDMLLEPIRVVLAQIGAFLPRLALAVAVLLVGWVVARMARFAVVKGLRAINFNVLTERAGTDGFLQQGESAATLRIFLARWSTGWSSSRLW